MGSWLSPQFLLSIGSCLVLIAAAWGDLRARVAAHVRETAERRGELLGQLAELKAGIELIRGLNGTRRIENLERKGEEAEKRALHWIPQITALQTRVDTVERELAAARQQLPRAPRR